MNCSACAHILHYLNSEGGSTHPNPFEHSAYNPKITSPQQLDILWRESVDVVTIC